MHAIRVLIRRGKALSFNELKKVISQFQNLVRRAHVTLAGKDDKQFSTSQVSAMDRVMNIETVYPYGMSANAPVDTLVLIFNVQGDEGNVAGIPYSSLGRFKDLKPGEVIFGNPGTDSFVKFLADGGIEINAKGIVTVKAAGQVVFDAPVVCNQGFNANGTSVMNLGTGGAAIARAGDPVKVNVGGTDYFGTIISGGQNTSL